MEKNNKVLLGMSGGVDSSVSALLLKNTGYDVVGVTLELFAGSSCCNTNTYMDAKNICNQIGIPHFIFNYQKEFKENVINDFICSYANCQTPNPCIECNKYLKFGYMYEKAKELGVPLLPVEMQKFVLTKAQLKTKPGFTLSELGKNKNDRITIGDIVLKFEENSKNPTVQNIKIEYVKPNLNLNENNFLSEMIEIFLKNNYSSTSSGEDLWKKKKRQKNIFSR